MNALVPQGPNSPVSRRSERAHVVELAARQHGLAAEFLRGPLRAVGHRAAGGRRRRAVDVGRAEVHVDAVDELGIEHLVGEQRVVAGVVQRHAVEGDRDARAVEAADAQVAARGAVRIAVGEVDARDLVEALEHALARRLRLEVLARERDARLRRGLVADDADVAHARGADTTTSVMSSSIASVPVDCANAFCARPAPNKTDGGKRPFVESEQHRSVDVTHEVSPVICAAISCGPARFVEYTLMT